jgi:hypothetical protein
VESAFAAYVIMICYDFEKGGINQSARNSRFHEIIKKLNMETVPISYWDFDKL